MLGQKYLDTLIELFSLTLFFLCFGKIWWTKPDQTETWAVSQILSLNAEQLK